MKCAVVILNWNTEDYLRKFLPGVLDSTAGIADVVVADNASSDGSVELLRSEFPAVQRIEFDRNYGFTGGYDKALAQLEGYDYFVLLNSDIETPRGWLQPLVEWMEKTPSCGICAPKLHSYYEKNLFEYAGAAGGYIDRYGYPFCRGRILKRVEKDSGQYDGPPSRVFWATGACLMVRSSLWKELGGLDERFFAHMEEIDFCWRAALRGYETHVVTDSVVYHLGGGTLPNNSPFKLRLNFRNNLLMLRNNLAQTLALEYHSRGVSAHKAARKGLAMASRRIFTRKILDGCAAAGYLLCGKLSYVKAVAAAHREYRSLRTPWPEASDIERFLENSGGTKIEGIYKGCMPLRAMLISRKSPIFVQSKS